ncbi:MAG: hypothetical protein KGR26_00100 [Cyanobacteria bacterium REEB65]|nr:hypothetical protein [Cyanobacteria bacterium REEB65]
MSHQKCCRVCGRFRSPKFYGEDSVWQFKGYHRVQKTQYLSKLVCQACYKALRKTGPLLEPAPPCTRMLEELAELALETRGAPLRDDWRYADAVEQMTAEEHAFEVAYDFNVRLECMTISSAIQEGYERDRRPVDKVYRIKRT